MRNAVVSGEKIRIGNAVAAVNPPGANSARLRLVLIL